MNFHNYTAAFSDGTVKTGITSQPFHRLQDYIQEAHRHGVTVQAVTMTPPAQDKAMALRLETALCRFFEDHAIHGHREWFKRDVSWCSTERQRRRDRASMAGDVAFKMHYEWGKENNYSPGVIKAKRYRLPWVYHPVIELAEELGRCGHRISATKAARLAESLLAPRSTPESNPAQSAETARPAASSSDAGSSGLGAR